MASDLEIDLEPPTLAARFGSVGLGGIVSDANVRNRVKYSTIPLERAVQVGSYDLEDEKQRRWGVSGQDGKRGEISTRAQESVTSAVTSPIASSSSDARSYTMSPSLFLSFSRDERSRPLYRSMILRRMCPMRERPSLPEGVERCNFLCMFIMFTPRTTSASSKS